MFFGIRNIAQVTIQKIYFIWKKLSGSVIREKRLNCVFVADEPHS